MYQTLQEVAENLGVEHLDKIVYSWLLMHPAEIIPISGTGKITRLKHAVEALEITMDLQDWFKIYNASTGEELP